MKHKYLIIAIFLIGLFSCKKESENHITPEISLNNESLYTQNEQFVPVGGKLKFGIKAISLGEIITDLKIIRVSDGKTIVELDKGIFSRDSFSMDFNPTKSIATKDIWKFFIMNSNRDSASTTLTVNLGAGSAYGEINHYPSIIIGMQNNTGLPNYVDLHTGNLYTKTNISGHEGAIDLVAFVYTTSGILSPTLCCPGYTGSSSVTGADRYPEIESWSVKNLTSYDYYSSDNNLVPLTDFDNAKNDSLLVTAFKPGSVSGLCKYCFTNRIIPFKTEDGKYGMVHVKHADQTTNGYMELEIKIQK